MSRTLSIAAHHTLHMRLAVTLARLPLWGCFSLCSGSNPIVAIPAKRIQLAAFSESYLWQSPRCERSINQCRRSRYDRSNGPGHQTDPSVIRRDARNGNSGEVLPRFHILGNCTDGRDHIQLLAQPTLNLPAQRPQQTQLAASESHAWQSPRCERTDACNHRKPL
jgi:hypothetical protein